MKNPDAKNQTFGGKTVLLGDECRQILPVIPQGNRADTVLASISQLYLWESCHKFSKKTNMRVNQTEKEFYDWVLKVRRIIHRPQRQMSMMNTMNKWSLSMKSWLMRLMIAL